MMTMIVSFNCQIQIGDSFYKTIDTLCSRIMLFYSRAKPIWKLITHLWRLLCTLFFSLLLLLSFKLLSFQESLLSTDFDTQSHHHPAHKIATVVSMETTLSWLCPPLLTGREREEKTLLLKLTFQALFKKLWVKIGFAYWMFSTSCKAFDIQYWLVRVPS